MKCPRTLLLLALLPLGSCGENSVEAARKAAAATLEALATSADAIAAEVAHLDLAALDPEFLRAKGAWLLQVAASQLDQVRDSAGAAQVAASIEAALDAGGELLSRVQGELPSREHLAQSVRDLRARSAGDAGVLQALEPTLERLERWLAEHPPEQGQAQH